MSSRSVLLALVFLLAAAPPPPASAAELRISDGEVVVKDGVAYVKVDVSWRLSWRNETNWDAAWLTVKAPVGREGVPLKLAPAGHRVVDTRTPDQPDPTFSVSDDSVGTFVYRDTQTDGRGPNDWTLRLRLVLPEDATPADLPEPLLVHGVEMVYISEGPFSVGDPQRPENAPPMLSTSRRPTPPSSHRTASRTVGPSPCVTGRARSATLGSTIRTTASAWATSRARSRRPTRTATTPFTS